MKFEFEGQTYVIEFQREFRDVKFYRRGEVVTEQSKNPFTTVRIVLLPKDRTQPKQVYRTATVGCAHIDHFTAEQGRKYALRAIQQVGPQFRKAMWEAYLGRGEQPQAHHEQRTGDHTI